MLASATGHWHEPRLPRPSHATRGQHGTAKGEAIREFLKRRSDCTALLTRSIRRTITHPQ